MTQQPKRRRGVILTAQGKQKLLAAIRTFESEHHFGEKYTIEELSHQTGLDPGTVAKVLDAEEGADRRTLDRFFQRFNLELTDTDYQRSAFKQDLQKSAQSLEAYQNPKSKIQNRLDWHEAVDVSIFYGRTEELTTLKQWILEDRCRLVALLGMGGIGKTSLAARLGEQIQDQFDAVVWRSLKDAPRPKELVASLIQFVSNQQETEADLPNAVNPRITRLLEYLRNHRCLLVLDNAESILQEGQAGVYRDGYEGYGELLKRVGEAAHQSCLILTSREKPKELTAIEGASLPVRCWQMRGIADVDGQAILKIKGLALSGSEDQSKELIHRYAGNPLALKLVATTIQELFDGDIAEFLQEETIAFAEIRTLLDQQFDRLSALEKSIMYWLAINRELVPTQVLQEDIIPLVPKHALLEALKGLVGRSLVEKTTACFTQQAVVMEYVTDRIIKQISHELGSNNLDLFSQVALIKAQTKNYIRETQIRLILSPITDYLTQVFGHEQNVELQLRNTLKRIQADASYQSGYATGNLLNIFCHLLIDLNGYDFSRLTIRQAYLQGIDLPQVNFARANFIHCTFTQTLGTAFSIAFSPDGKLLAAGDTYGAIHLWRVSDGQPLATYPAHTNWIRSIAFSPNGKILVSGGEDQTIRLWNVTTHQCLHVLQGHTEAVWSIALSPQGQLLASGSADKTIRIWNIETGECLHVLDVEALVSFVVFSNGGKFLAGGLAGGKIGLWDVDHWHCIGYLEGNISWIRLGLFSPQGDIFANSKGRMVQLWDVDTRKCVQNLEGHTELVNSVAFHPNGGILASGSDDRTIRLWDLNTQQCLAVLQGHIHAVCSVAFSPDGTLLASSSSDHTIRVWDITTYECIYVLQGYNNSIRAVAFSPNGKLLATGSEDHTVRLWDITAQQCLRALRKHLSRVRTVAFSPDSSILASGSTDHSICFWDTSTHQYLYVLKGHTHSIRSIIFSPNGKLLASGSTDCKIRLWDLESRQCMQVIRGHKNSIRSLAFSPDEKLLVSGSDDRTIRLWDMNTHDCLHTLQEKAKIRCIALNPDGKILASVGNDRIIRLWDITTQDCLYSLEGHTNWIQSVSFSPHGQFLVTGGEDHTVRVWNLVSRKCLQVLQGHTNWVMSVVFSPDGQMIASGSMDGTLRLWNVGTGLCLSTLQIPRPYEGTNIVGATGLTIAQKTSLVLLGATENSEILTKEQEA